MHIKFHGGDEESGEVFVVETKAEAGVRMGTHTHAHAHLGVLVSGTARVTVAGHSEVMTGYRMVQIPAGCTHEIEAITDMVWLCLWADHLADKEQAKASLKLIPGHD